MKNGVETSYKNANKMGIDCPCCGHTNEFNFEAKMWTCDNCKHETKWTGIIYRAVSRYNQKVYIGQTELPLRTRINSHKSKKSDKSSVFVNIIRKYGPDNFDWSIEEIIEEGSSIDINDSEVKWIREYNSFVGWEGSWGYNCTIGGSKTIFSPESIAKRSGDNHHNALLTPENARTIKLLLRDTGLYLNEIAELFGVTFNTVFDIKRKRSWTQIKISDRDCLSNGYNQYLTVPKERREPFFAFELGSYKFIGKFFERKECANQLGVNKSQISAVLYGRKKTVGNYTFIFVQEYTKNGKNIYYRLFNNYKKKRAYVT